MSSAQRQPDEADRKRQETPSQEPHERSRSACPACGAHGLLVDSTKTVAYFVCPVCECTWRQPPAAPST
jgi:hypothetical protein